MFVENQKHLVLRELFLGKGYGANLHILVHTPFTPRKSTACGWSDQQLLQSCLLFFFLNLEIRYSLYAIKMKGSETIFLRELQRQKSYWA